MTEELALAGFFLILQSPVDIARDARHSAGRIDDLHLFQFNEGGPVYSPKQRKRLKRRKDLAKFKKSLRGKSPAERERMISFRRRDGLSVGPPPIEQKPTGPRPQMKASTRDIDVPAGVGRTLSRGGPAVRRRSLA